VSDEKCLDRSQVDVLKREFMALLQHHSKLPDDGARKVFRMSAVAIEDSSPVMVTGGRS
jgi:hypothetical protein